MIKQFDDVTGGISTHFSDEIKTMRTGRATVDLLADISVESYGVQTPLPQLASISVGDARMLVVEPWDKSIVKDIEKAITSADRGLTSAVDGDKMRVSVPEMTEETRKSMVRTLNEKLEKARVSIRRARENEKKKTIRVGQAARKMN